MRLSSQTRSVVSRAKVCGPPDSSITFADTSTICCLQLFVFPDRCLRPNFYAALLSARFNIHFVDLRIFDGIKTCHVSPLDFIWAANWMRHIHSLGTYLSTLTWLRTYFFSNKNYYIFFSRWKKSGKIILYRQPTRHFRSNFQIFGLFKSGMFLNKYLNLFILLSRWKNIFKFTFLNFCCCFYSS